MAPRLLGVALLGAAVVVAERHWPGLIPNCRWPPSHSSVWRSPSFSASATTPATTAGGKGESNGAAWSSRHAAWRGK
ncbi:hypothetical protein ACFQU7_02945 [Pseudoroseomonas wenyumeiae]